MTKKAKKLFDEMAVSIGKFMKTQDWNIVLIGSPKIARRGSLKYNFELIFDFTGNKMKGKKK